MSSQEKALEFVPGLVFRRSARARQYRLTLQRDGRAAVTIPVHGTEAEARAFAARHGDWLARARGRQARRPRAPAEWTLGTPVLWRGELSPIRNARAGASVPAGGLPQVCIAADVFTVPALNGDLRAALEAQFARRAKIELSARAWELAAAKGADLKHVTVRNQRSRWGSCSAAGTVSLNWRLVQVPAAVCDYIICHELAHLRHLNHSARFWAQVEAYFPAWREAERWLKEQGSLLGL